MISQDTGRKAVEIAALAKSLGRNLSPKANAPLSVLCRNTDYAIGLDESTELAQSVATECFDSNNALVQAGERLAAGADSTHDGYQDELTAQVGQAVVKHIGFINGAILPQVRELTTRVKERMGQVDVNPLAKYNVQVLSLPAGLLTDAFQNDLDRKTSGRLFNPPSLVVAEENFDYTSLIKTGFKALDDENESWFRDSITPMLVWGLYFDRRVLGELSNSLRAQSEPLLRQLVQDGLNGAVTLVDGLTHNVYGGDIAFAVYLFSQGLSKATLANPQHNEKEFQSLIEQYQDVAGTRLLQHIKQWEAKARTATVVQYADPTSGRLRVYGPAFNAFISQGGSQEALLGRLVGGTQQVSADDLLADKDELEKAWSRFVAGKRSEERLQRHAVAVQVIKEVFYDLLARKEFSDMEQAYLDSHPGHLDRAGDAFDVLLGELSYADIDAIDDTCCRLLCETRFSYTNALQFFEYMKEAFAGGTTNPRAAAESAKIQYVIDYVVSQIEVA